MALLAERIPAAQAFEWGLVSHLVDDDAFEAELEALVGRLASGPTLAHARTKAALAASTLALLSRRSGSRATVRPSCSTPPTSPRASPRSRRRPPRFTGR